MYNLYYAFTLQLVRPYDNAHSALRCGTHVLWFILILHLAEPK